MIRPPKGARPETVGDCQPGSVVDSADGLLRVIGRLAGATGVRPVRQRRDGGFRDAGELRIVPSETRIARVLRDQGFYKTQAGESADMDPLLRR